MKQIDIIYFDVTSGHRSAALALKKAFAGFNPSAQVRVLNLVDVLRHQPVLQMLAHTGVNLFNWGVRADRDFFSRQQIRSFQIIQENVPPFAIRQVAKFWQDTAPDVVVSVLPICNLLLERALHTIHPRCPYVVIPVDYEEALPNYWFDRRMDAQYINPTLRLAEQAAAQGIEPRLHARVKGMPIDPLFYEPPAFERAQELTELGLNPDYPTILVGFGGQGSILVKQCALELLKLKHPFNAIFLCGRHQAIRDELAALPTPYPKLVLGFTPEPPAYYYHLADIMVGKPGSMTITEAIITRTAFLAIESNALSIVQRGNEAWLRQSGVGNVIKLPELAQSIEQILAAGGIHSNFDGEYHRGVFEIAHLLSRVSQGAGLSHQADTL